jgi:hypothetical protein
LKRDGRSNVYPSKPCSTVNSENSSLAVFRKSLWSCDKIPNGKYTSLDVFRFFSSIG